MIKKILISLLVLIIVLGLSGFAYFQLNKSPQIFEKSIAGIYHTEPRLVDERTRVTIDTGELIGFADNYDTFAWLGIPYVEPPVGDLRWRAPQPAKSWRGLREATEYGSQCIQYWGRLAGQDGDWGDLLGSEDCLSLNIWAPQNAKPNRPVMLWIHGGGNDSGTAMTYQGHHLAGRHDVVVVGINYRLGFLGWFNHSAVRKTADNLADASGNYGTLDIIAALRWVQNNIEAFNGDPNSVTIFGESAGGRNVFSLMASPLAKGLFHRAISQSGTVETTPQSQAEPYPDEPPKRAISGLRNSSSTLIELVAREQNPELDKAALRAKLDKMPASDIMVMMRTADAYDMMKLATENSGIEGNIQIANVVQDGYVVLTKSTLALMNSPQSYNDVPLITGTTRDEQKVFLSANPEYVDFRLGVLPKVKDQQWYDLVSDYVSQMWKAGAVDEPAKRITKAGGQPVFAYRFDWDESPSNFLIDVKGLLGAAHGMELNYVFGDFVGGPPYHPTYNKANAEGRKLVSLAMMDYWAGFAHAGSPGKGYSGKQPEWAAWSDTGNNIMLFDEPNDGGVRMDEVRTNVADIKQRIIHDTLMTEQKDKCRAYANLFLHGYQTDDFWSPREYAELGCEDFPAGEFRER